MLHLVEAMYISISTPITATGSIPTLLLFRYELVV